MSKNKKKFLTYKTAVSLCVSALICLFAQWAAAVDILEIRIKRLYKEAQALVEKGDYDTAIELYNKAIIMAKDRDIRQFLINAKKESQQKRRAEKGDFRIFSMNEEPEEIIFESPISGDALPVPKIETPVAKTADYLGGESAGLEEERAALEAERRKLEVEKAQFEWAMRLEEEKKKLAAERAKIEEERAQFEEEKRKALKELEETPEEVMIMEEMYSEDHKEAVVVEQKTPDEDKEAPIKAEEETALKRTESKLNDLAALDQQAEALMSEGKYNDAKVLYEKILAMSKDPDIKEHIKKQRGDDQNE